MPLRVFLAGLLLFLLAVPLQAGEYLVICGQYGFRSRAAAEVAALAARGLPAQLVDGSQYRGLGPGIWAVGLGAWPSDREAEAAAEKFRVAGLTVQLLPAGRYIGISRSDRVRAKTDRYLIVAAIDDDREKLRTRRAELQGEGFLPRLISGKDFANLHPGMWYLILDLAETREAAESRARESLRMLKDLQILRAGFYRGRGRDPLEDMESHWERTLRWREKYREAMHLRGLGDKGLALSAFRECLKLAPEHEACRLEVLRILVERQNWDAARPEIERLRDEAGEGPRPELDYYLCLIRMETDRENCLAHFRDYRELYPRSPYLPDLARRAGWQEK